MAQIFTTYTTYQIDFTKKQISNNKTIKSEESDYEEILPPIKQPPQYDLETMSKLKQNIYIPFNLLHRPKEIVHSNPYEPIKELKVEEKIFEEKLAVRKIRPRVIIEPQIIIDDIPVEKMYGKNGLAEWIYSSDWKDATNYVVENSPLKKQENNNDNKITETSDDGEPIVHSAQVRKVLLQKPIMHVTSNIADIPPLERRFVRYARDWEKQQRKDYVDKTSNFWDKNRDKGLCNLCDPQPQDKAVTDDEAKEIENCMRDDSFRLSYTILNPAYAGFRPKVPLGIGYQKKLFKIGDPYVTTLMYDQGVYRKQ